jgi:prevent-host-death family protein
MNLSVTDAKARLTELVRRAESGEEVVLTRHGHPTVKLIAVSPEQKAQRIGVDTPSP